MHVEGHQTRDRRMPRLIREEAGEDRRSSTERVSVLRLGEGFQHHDNRRKRKIPGSGKYPGTREIRRFLSVPGILTDLSSAKKPEDFFLSSRS